MIPCCWFSGFSVVGGNWVFRSDKIKFIKPINSYIKILNILIFPFHIDVHKNNDDYNDDDDDDDTVVNCMEDLLVNCSRAADIDHFFLNMMAGIIGYRYWLMSLADYDDDNVPKSSVFIFQLPFHSFSNLLFIKFTIHSCGNSLCFYNCIFLKCYFLCCLFLRNNIFKNITRRLSFCFIFGNNNQN